MPLFAILSAVGTAASAAPAEDAKSSAPFVHATRSARIGSTAYGPTERNPLANVQFFVDPSNASNVHCQKLRQTQPHSKLTANICSIAAQPQAESLGYW